MQVIDGLERLGAVILAGMIILGLETGVLYSAFGEGQTLLVTAMSSALSLVLGGYLITSPRAGRGRRGVVTALVGGGLTVLVISVLPRDLLKGGAATALAICLMSCLWVVPHMAALELLARGMTRLKNQP